jgi:hypothetical protein
MGKREVQLPCDSAPLHEDILVSGGTAPRILDVGTRWSWVVSFIPRLLYTQGKSSWYTLDRRLGGPQSLSGRGGEEKNSQCRETWVITWGYGSSLLKWNFDVPILNGIENDVIKTINNWGRRNSHRQKGRGNMGTARREIVQIHFELPPARKKRYW